MLALVSSLLDRIRRGFIFLAGRINPFQRRDIMRQDNGDIEETEEISAGEAAQVDSSRVASRADRPDLLTQDQLNQRQESTGRTRRQAGPRLERRRDVPPTPETEAPDVPETEPEEAVEDE